MLEIINVVTPNANIFLCIAASVAYSAAVNPNSTKTLLANGLSTVFIKGNQVLVTVLKVCLKILVIAPCRAAEFLIILY